MVPALARFVRCSMGYTTSYWQKERWSRRVADMHTSYGLCWNPSIGTWDVNGASAWNIIRLNRCASAGSLSQCGNASRLVVDISQTIVDGPTSECLTILHTFDNSSDKARIEHLHRRRRY